MLFGVVPCATTQLADNNRIENSVALDFIAVSRLRCDIRVIRGTLGVSRVDENPVDPLAGCGKRDDAT